MFYMLVRLANYTKSVNIKTT